MQTNMAPVTAQDEPINTPRPFAAICQHFFGRLPGQSLKEFGDELRKLTPIDRADMMRDFEKIGYVLKKDW